jgi:hypothetical protein
LFDNVGGFILSATTSGGRQLSNHAEESLVRHGYREPFTDVDNIIDNPSRVRIQNDGATVYIQSVPGRGRRYNIIIVNDDSVIITGLRNITAQELSNLGQNYGFDPNP